MYQIKLVNGNNQFITLYDQSQMNGFSATSPKYNFEINEAGSLTFTLMKDNPYYDILEPLAHYISSYDDAGEFFYGRIIHRSEPKLKGQITFTCEGALSFLLDSELAPYPKDNKGNTIPQTKTAEAFFRECIQAHNDFVGDDTRRQFTIGIINAAKKDKQDEYTISNYTQVKSAITSQILDVYGGFIRIRPKDGGGHYIDWIENYETVNPQQIIIGNNVEEQTNEADGSSLFTVLRPIGADGLELTEKTIDLYSSADMAKYGRIVKTVDFKSANTEAKLRTEANEYKDRIQKTLFVNSSVSLVDMHYLDGTIPMIRGGDRFTNLNGLTGVEMVAASLEIDFERPQNDTVGFKNRKSLDPDLTPEGNAHSRRRSGSGSGSGSGNGTLRWIREIDNTLEILAPIVNAHGEELNQHYAQINMSANNYIMLSRRANAIENTLNPIKKRWDNLVYTVDTISGTAVIQNSQAISQIAGVFDVWTDENGQQHAHLVNGTQLDVDGENGALINVGERVNQAISDVDGMQRIVDTINGSALWTQRDAITGICGEFEIQWVRVPDPDNPGSYILKKQLVVKSGGGIVIQQNGVTLGVYRAPDAYYRPVPIPSDTSNIDPKALNWFEKTESRGYVPTNDRHVISGKVYYEEITSGSNPILTGGLIVEKINNETTTKIKGDHVEITSDDVTIVGGNSLTSVVGHWYEEEYEYVDDNGDTQIGHRLVYTAEGGMRVRREDENGVVSYFGIYDEDNLTAGIITRKINGTPTAIIKGSRIVIGNDLDAEKLPEWAADKEGLISAKATIAQLNTEKGRIDDIISDYITSTNLKSSVGDIDQLLVKSIAGSSTTSDAYFDKFQGHKYEVSLSGGPNISYTRDLCDGVYDLHIAGPVDNVYTLQKKAIGDNDWTDVGTFSRATDLTVTWDSGEIKVTARPQGNEIKRMLRTSDKENQDGTEYTDHNKKWRVPVLAKWGAINQQTGDYEHSESTGFYVYVDATSIYNDGRNAITLSGPTWDSYGWPYGYNNNNYTPSSRTVSFNTVGKSTNTPIDLWIGLKQDDSFSSHKKKVYLYEDNLTTGTRRAGIEIDATSEYNAGSPSSGVVGTKASTIKHWNFTIAKGDGSTKSIEIDCSSIYTDARTGYYTSSEYNANRTNGQNDVTLVGPSWDSYGWAYGYNGSYYPTARTISVETSGRPTKLTASQWVGLKQDSSFSNHKKKVYIVKDSNSGSYMAGIEVDATSEYNAGCPTGGYTYDKVSNTGYRWYFDIAKGDGSTQRLNIDCTSIYYDARDGYYTLTEYTNYGTEQRTAGKNDVTLSVANWDGGNTKYYDGVNNTMTARSITVTTIGRPTQLSTSAWIGILQSGDHCYIVKDDWNGSRMAGVAISGYHPTSHANCARALTRFGGTKQKLYTRSQNSSGNWVYTQATSDEKYWYYSDGDHELATYYS